jgi:hypothetical protein
MTFSMTIMQVFNFADGRTVLAGFVEGDVGVIRPGRYGLYQGSKLVREVEVEGEMMPRTTQGVRGERVVSIADRVGLPSGKPQGGLVLLNLG